MKHSKVTRLSCKIFFVKRGKIYEAKQTVPHTISGYSGYYGGFYPRVERRSQISGVKLARRRDVIKLFKSMPTRLARRRSGSVY